MTFTIDAPAVAWPHRHLLDVDALSREELLVCLDLAVEMRARRSSGERLTTLAGETVGLAFYEPSTRTRVSFELAARALGASTVDLSVAGSSVTKGESLADTLRTLERTGVTTIVLRHTASGAPYEAVRAASGARIVNAGDGQHAHPTQALLDSLTLREALGDLDGRRIAIVGDVAHSRVARSNVHALTRLGAQIVVGGPAAWVRGFDAAYPGVRVARTLAEALEGADAVMALRVQLEREATSGASLATYVRDWGLTGERLERLAPEAVLLHPGPVNEGVEVSAELASSPRSLIGRQVENGVAVRMAVLALGAA